MRLVFAGTPETAVPALEAVLASGHELVAVVTRPDAPAGRGRKLVASPVALVATAAGVEVLTPATPRDPAFLARLAELAPDCCPVVAYGALMPPAALAIPAHGWVNLHFSLLPAWRGAAPVQHARSCTATRSPAPRRSCSRRASTPGPVFGVVTERIRPSDTSGDLLGPARRSRGRSCWSPPSTGSRTARFGPAAAADGVSLAPKLTVDDASGRLDGAGPARRPTGPRLHACPGRVDDPAR